MWLFTSKSFVSVVVDKDNPSRRLVRARCKGDIEELFPDAGVFEDETADYRYRTFISTEDLIQKMTQYIENMDYTNFKNSISPDKKQYHDACVGVWSIMLGLQKSESNNQ